MRLALPAAAASLAFSLAVPSLRGQAADDRWGVELDHEILVSDNEDGGLLRVEPSVAVHGDVIVAAWNDGRGLREGAVTGTSVAWSISRDGGRSFRFGGYIPAPDPDLPPAGADSWLGVDGTGRFYLIVLSWWEESYAVRLLTLDPTAGGTWTEQEPVAVRDRVPGAPVLDKPAMTVTTDGQVFVVYKSGDRIRLRRSPDGGESWDPAVTVSDSDGATGLDSTVPSRNSSDVAVLGETVVVCWLEESGFSAPQELWCAESPDRGRTFSPARRLHRAARHMPAPPGYRMGPGPYSAAPNYASLAADEGRGLIHLVAADPAGEEGSRILHWSYDVARRAWNDPGVVGGGPGLGTKVMASAAVASDGLLVLYYDQRRAGEGHTDVRLSSRARQEWRDTPVTTVSSDWTAMPPGETFEPPFQKNAGDYISLAADGGRFVAVWTDGRRGEPRIWARAGHITGAR